MKWLSKWVKNSNRLGTHRTVKRFAIFPVCINGEYRWLETVYIRQTFKYDYERINEYYWYNEYFTTRVAYENYKSGYDICA